MAAWLPEVWSSDLSNCKSQRWTVDQLTLLEKLEAQKLPWRDIADRIGRNEASCQTAMTKLRKQRRREAGLPEVTVVKRAWTQREVEELLRLREVERMRWHQIEKLLNRENSARTKYEALRRARRKEALLSASDKPSEHLTITASVLGDPLPGRSALDKKRAGIVENLPPSNHREVYFASRPRITLATEPLR
jgi:hypothetical protein